MNARAIDRLVTVVDQLPEEKVVEVLDFAQYLLSRTGPRFEDSDAFFAWTEEIARTHGFDHLTEEEVAQIVHESRKTDS